MQFLLDQRSMDRAEGVRRALGRPVKQTILSADRPWERASLQGHQAVLFDRAEGKYKLWYRAACPSAEDEPKRPNANDANVDPSERGAVARRVFLCYAESSNGLDWTKPALGLFPFGGDRANNIVREIGSGDSMFWNIVKDEAETDPSRRYKCLGFDQGARSHAASRSDDGRGICVGYSADGLRWTAEPQRVVSTEEVTDGDTLLPRRDPRTGKWIGFFRPRTHPKRRFLACSESDDFTHWSAPRMILAPGPEDAPWTEFYGLTACEMGSCWIGLLWVLRNHPDASPITPELVWSRSGAKWQRLAPGTPFLPLGADDAADARMILVNGILESGAEHRIYFTGTNFDHGSDYGQPMSPGRVVAGQTRRAMLGVARLPWGQWCGLRADATGLIETTYLCNYRNGGVSAVLDLQNGGKVECELLDPYGKTLPGWERDRSRARMAADGKTCLFSWGEGRDGSPGQQSAAGVRVGHVVKLRFHLREATLFGYQIGGA